MRLSFSLCLAALNVVPCLQEILEICAFLCYFGNVLLLLFARRPVLLDFVPDCFFQDALRSARLSETFANLCAYGPCVFNRF